MDASTIEAAAIRLAESGRVPDAVLRWVIRRMCRQRLREDVPTDPALAQARTETFLAVARRAAIAIAPERANAQHYELPAAFFERVLGPHLKYSCALWEAGTTTLAEAEVAALRETCEHAALGDGQRVLELGCGWGSLTLWMAERYPRSRVTAVSNSASQREHVMGRARARGLSNVEVITADVNEFEPSGRFDRVVSVEMLEHVRNHARLFERIARWLEPSGVFFAHVFCQRDVPYAFGSEAASDWMGRYFFTGGTMPSDGLFLRLQDHLRVAACWRWSGTHYARTADAWLENLDREHERVLEVLARTYGAGEARVWCQRWRMFFMACAELFGYDGGRQWWVSHYRMTPR
jgi:cyclopropane-fatty-acyl-phospholipid synthase